MRDAHRQLSAGVRFDWGLDGANALATTNGCLVVVDVLSFTTTVSVAVDRGMAILPYPWRADAAKAFAISHDAQLAVGRSEATQEHPWSLSGSALLAAEFTPRLVLPSPNGSTISAASDGLVVTSSLRNGSAVVTWLLYAKYGTPEKPIVVIAAGEQWRSGNSLRPAVEDLFGAGQVLSQLKAAGCSLSAEADIAATVYESTDDITNTIRACASSQELIEDGFADDVAVATEIDADSVVPTLINDAFVDAN